MRALAHTAIHYVHAARAASGKLGEISLFVRWPDAGRLVTRGGSRVAPSAPYDHRAASAEPVGGRAAGGSADRNACHCERSNVTFPRYKA